MLPLTRRLEFPGKRRLRRRVRLPESGMRDVTLGGGRFRLDLAESLHRDYYFGLCDQVEMRLIRRLLGHGGDFVDVGAHIGMYSVSIAQRITGRVLALEPNPSARALLEENLVLNECENVIVERVAVADAPGYAALHIPTGGDSSWSTLDGGRLDGERAVDVEVSTLDVEVERHGLRPAVVKIDVEGVELDVLRGGAQTLARRPALLVELAEWNAEKAIAALARFGYGVARAGTRGLELWSTGFASNAVFLQPGHLQLLRTRERRNFACRSDGATDEREASADQETGQSVSDDLEARLLHELV